MTFGMASPATDRNHRFGHRIPYGDRLQPALAIAERLARGNLIRADLHLTGNLQAAKVSKARFMEAEFDRMNSKKAGRADVKNWRNGLRGRGRGSRGVSLRTERGRLTIKVSFTFDVPISDI